jgi:SAM-dependent methyltransferase
MRRLIQSYAPGAVKSRLWDAEFANGQWACLDSTPDDCVYVFLDKYADGGSILDLGCGSGNTANELSQTAYLDYTGVDISEVAIEKAKKRSEENGRCDRTRFLKSDVSSYVPAQPFDVILFRDTIYYIPRASIRAMLERYSKYLTPDGVFVVRLWDGRDKHRNIVKLIESHFDVVEKYLAEESKVVVLVFRHSERTDRQDLTAH